MSRGRRATADASFGRSAGGAALRAVMLLLVALGLGLALLAAAADAPPPDAVAAAPPTPSTAPQRSTTTTTAAVTTTSQPVTTTTTTPPRDVRVIAANGTGVPYVATRVGERLHGAGYTVLPPTSTRVRSEAPSSVHYAPGFERQAQAVAAALGPPLPPVSPLPAVPQVADLRGANVLVVVGADRSA